MADMVLAAAVSVGAEVKVFMGAEVKVFMGAEVKVFMGAEVKVFMGVVSAVAASVTVVDMLPVPEAGESRKARGEVRPRKAPEGMEPLKVPQEVKLPEDPVGLMGKGLMAAVITTETPM